jgi:glucokinase
MSDPAFAAAADIGATNQRMAIIRDDGRIIARHQGRLETDPQSVLDAFTRTISHLSARHGVQVSAAGLALPAPVDVVRGRTITHHLDPPINWDATSIPNVLGAALGVPVAIENDGNAAAIGEGWIGAAKDLSDYVFVAVGTGIGAGIVIDRQIHRG